MSIANGPLVPRLELVVAMAMNGVIGKGNALPWHLPDDLTHFKSLTMGQPILMGRRTWDSLGRALPGRLNLVMSRAVDFAAPGATVVHDLPEALSAAGRAPALRVIGGAELYRLCLPSARTLHLTEVDAVVDGDVRFPEWSRAEWVETSRESRPAGARHAHGFSFITLERRAR